MTAENHRPQRPGQDAREEFRRQLAAKRARKLRAQRLGEHQAWFGLGMFGVVGWSVAIPAVACIALGVWIDRVKPGRYSWTLMLLVVGMALGCLNGWFWLARERRIIEQERNREEDSNLDGH